MRKHFFLVIEHPEERYEGEIYVTGTGGSQMTTARKDQRGVRRKKNSNSGEEYEQVEVGLGYHDFEDEEDYHENGGDVILGKLEEIDGEHLVEAGLDPEEVFSDDGAE